MIIDLKKLEEGDKGLSHRGKIVIHSEKGVKASGRTWAVGGGGKRQAEQVTSCSKARAVKKTKTGAPPWEKENGPGKGGGENKVVRVNNQ